MANARHYSIAMNAESLAWLAEGDDYDFGDPEELLVPMKFTDDFKSLPAAGPDHHAHIIHSSCFDQEYELDSPDIRIWDAIATFLFHVSTEVLQDFLNPEIKEYKFILKPNSALWSQIVIWRRNNQVFVGNFNDHSKDYGCLEWDIIARCIVSFDGGWKLTSATSRQTCKPDLDEAWAGRLNDDTWCQKPEDDKGKTELARSLGKYIIDRGCLDHEYNTWTIEKSQ